MNELERQLTQALTELSEQYAMDMKRLEEQNTVLSEQVQALSGQVKELEPFLVGLTVALADLGLMKPPMQSSGG